MKNQDFTTTILVDQTPEEVFKAVNSVSAWWHGEVKGETHKLNDEFTYHYGDVHYSKQKLVELIPGKKVAWLVTDSRLNFVENKTEWTGTQICFEMTQQGKQTQMKFTHIGLVPGFECFNGCSGGWTQLIQKSLFSLITTGKGKDVF